MAHLTTLDEGKPYGRRTEAVKPVQFFDLRVYSGRDFVVKLWLTTSDISFVRFFTAM